MWNFDGEDGAAALAEQGVWFCDDSVSDQVAAAVRQDILEAHKMGYLTKSGNVLAVPKADGQRAGVKVIKPHVFEADITVGGIVERPEVLQVCPNLAALLSQASEAQLIDLLHAARPELKLERVEFAKIQVNTGDGGAFPFHFDLPSAKDHRRLLTAILYLNPDWEEGWGGEVELLPFPFPNIKVPPANRRLVVFGANTVMHRVLPFTGSAPRVCVNLWFDGEVTTPFPPPLPPQDSLHPDLEKIVRVLRKQPAELRALCKVWYRDLITQSFLDAFDESPELTAAMALHDRDAELVASRIAASTMETLRTHVPLEPRVEKGEMVGLFDDL